LLWIIGYKWQK